MILPNISEGVNPHFATSQFRSSLSISVPFTSASHFSITRPFLLFLVITPCTLFFYHFLFSFIYSPFPEIQLESFWSGRDYSPSKKDEIVLYSWKFSGCTNYAGSSTHLHERVVSDTCLRVLFCESCTDISTAFPPIKYPWSNVRHSPQVWTPLGIYSSCSTALS